MRRLLQITLVGCALLRGSLAFSATPSVVLARELTQEVTDYCTDGDELCWHLWYRWTLKIDKALQGPDVKGRIKALRSQHAGFVGWTSRSQWLFVLVPIEDPDFRRKLQADYFIEDQSLAVPMYCLQEDPADLGLGVVPIHDPESGKYCFSGTPSSR